MSLQGVPQECCISNRFRRLGAIAEKAPVLRRLAFFDMSHFKTRRCFKSELVEIYTRAYTTGGWVGVGTYRLRSPELFEFHFLLKRTFAEQDAELPPFHSL